MNGAPKLSWTIVLGLLLIFLTLSLALLLQGVKRAPYHSGLPVYGQVTDFSLTNQTGAHVTLAGLKGKVWVADIIFTTCSGPCPRMTQQMGEIQKELPPQSKARLVSLTTYPEVDTPEVLRAYARQFDADTNRWMFLTGSKKELMHLAIDGLKLSSVDKKPEERESENDLFIHATLFVLVDKHGQLRGIYHTVGEGVDWLQSKKDLLTAIQQLERER